MRWDFGVLVAFFAAAFAAPTTVQGPLPTKPSSDAIVKMSQGQNTSVSATTPEAITIDNTTQNIFGDVISVTPPDSESIELEHLNDDTRFYPDYNDKDVISNDHFTEPPKPEEASSNQRSKRQVNDYDALSYEMYLDPTYVRKRRDLEGEPYRIDLDIPIDSDSEYTAFSDSSSSESTPDVQSTRSPESDHDSLSTQITYVIISEDESSPNGSVDKVTESQNYTVSEEHTTEVTGVEVPLDQGTTSSDSSFSSSSTDSKEERQRVFRAIANTIRARRRARSDNPKYRRRRSTHDTDESSSSDIGTKLISRKPRQYPYYRTDITSYRIGRSVSDSDSDDTEPEESEGLNMRDLSIDGTDLKLLDHVAPLPEYSSEFSELVNPSKTYVDGKLMDVSASETYPDILRVKRSLPAQAGASADVSTTEAVPETTTLSEGVDIVTATYPLGVDATKDNLSLPEGNFQGPRVYAKGKLLDEEQPSITGIAAPMEKEQTIPILDGSQTETVYSAPAGSLNLPLLIPVVGPTAHPGDEPRIELSLPQGYVPYIIQISPASILSPKGENGSTQINVTASPTPLTTTESASPTTTEGTTSAQPEVLKFVSNVPTVIVGAATSPSPATQNEVFNASTQTDTSSSVPEMSSMASIPTTSTASEGSLNNSDLQPQPEAAEVTPTTLLPSAAVSALPTTSAVDKEALEQSSGDKPIISEESETPNLTEEPASPTNQAPMTQESISEQATQASPTTQSEVKAVLPENQLKLEELVSDIHQSASSDLQNVPGPSSESVIGQTVESMTSVTTSMTTLTSEGTSAPMTPLRSEGTSAPMTSLTSEGTSAPMTVGQRDSADVTVAPFQRTRPRVGSRFHVVPILEKNSVMSPNGSFSYSFRSGNGIQVQESGYLKKDTPTKDTQGELSSNRVVQAVQGSYSYTAPDGRLISVRYVADENGFRPEGNDLPR